MDPKRALQIYVDRISKLRVSEGNVQENKLFLSLNKPHKAVCRQTIASWVVNVIRQTYNDTDLKVTAHSTRVIVLLGFCVKEPLYQLFWKQQTGVMT